MTPEQRKDLIDDLNESAAESYDVLSTATKDVLLRAVAVLEAESAQREKEERNAWVLAEVLKTHEGRISTHYEGCWKYHAGCLAALLTDEA